MSVLAYNGIVLPYCSTVGFRQSDRYDDVGGVDWYISDYDITVQCVITHDYLSLLDSTLTGRTGNPAAIMAVIRDRMMTPRKALSFTFNGFDLIPAYQSGLPGTVDADNGPKPQTFDYIETTNHTFIVTYHILASYWTSDTVSASGPVGVTNTPGSNVLFNRWTERVSIDNQQMQTRTRDGTYRIRSDNPSGVTPDALRNSFAVLGVPPDFIRDSSDYVLQADGLALQYTITDKERYKMPPKPAFEASGDYMESATRLGARLIGQATCRLKGIKSSDPQYSQSQLIQTALGVCLGKFAQRSFELGKSIRAQGWTIEGTQVLPFVILEEAYLKIDMFENEAEAMIRCSMTAPEVKIKIKDQELNVNADTIAFAAFAGMGTQTPLTGPDAPSAWYGQALRSYGGEAGNGILLQAAAYHDPNLANVILDKTTGNMTAGLQPGQAGLTRET